MEQHAAGGRTGDPDGKLTPLVSTQTPHYVHRLLGKILDVPQAHVRVMRGAGGGGFGGSSIHSPTRSRRASSPMLTGRPVKIALTREEVVLRPPSRPHPVLMWLKTGFTRTAPSRACTSAWLDAAPTAPTAWPPPSTPARSNRDLQDPVYKFEGARIFTNKPPCGPKRGHGTPQPRFAMDARSTRRGQTARARSRRHARRISPSPSPKTANHLT
jgi:CO/xanthine dehydrogenase Mo-binding subunit